MADTIFDVVVVGGGPAGYTAAIRASQLGMAVAIVEKEPKLGGTCLRVGCIPSKALLQSSARFEETQSHLGQHGIIVDKVKLDLAAMQKRKDGVVQNLQAGIAGLMKKNKIHYATGHAKIADRHTDGWSIQIDGPKATSLVGRRILLCPGSTEAALPGVQLDGDRIGSSTDALAYKEVPKKLVVIGAGAIGLELGSVWRRLGSEVTVVEYAPRVLATMDEELSTAAEKIFAKQGLKFITGAKVTGAKASNSTVRVSIEGQQDLSADRVLVAVGRIPNTKNLGLDKAGLSVDKRGRLEVDGHFSTSATGIFAVGDCVAGPMLAHKAEEEAVACVEMWATGYGHVNYDTVPAIVYTEPEVASVGKTEAQLKEENVPFKRGKFPFLANGRAQALGITDGFAKILAHAETDRILGAHIIGPQAGDLIVELAVSMNFEASSEDIARSCHPHPTLSEVLREAALAVDNRTLNM